MRRKSEITVSNHILASLVKHYFKKLIYFYIDHFTGEYLGPSHNLCNLLRRDDYDTFPVFCHNFSNYDSHLLISSISKKMERIKILTAIPLNTEKFKTIRINNLELKDSMSFLDGSLEKLVETLKRSNHKFPLMRKIFRDPGQRELLLSKGIYPYEFCESIEKLRNQVVIPPHSAFYSRLSLKNVSDKDYQHAKTVWKKFECKNMLDYTQIYVISDTVLLAEVMQTFRRKIYQEFRLDPCHFLSLPSLAKDVMLKTSQVSLELIHDLSMCYFFKSGIRGGLSYVNQRSTDIDELEKKTGEKYILAYIDCNSLYGAAMSRKLPVRGYRWLSEEELANFDINKQDFEDEKGYAFQVTLEYPPELQLQHSSYPLACHHLEVEEEELSPYAKECLEEFQMKYTKTKKLSATFNERKEYVLHGMNLKLYLQLGLRIKKLHSGVEFEQGDYMRKFVENCSEKRRNAVTEMDSMIAKRVSFNYSII